MPRYLFSSHDGFGLGHVRRNSLIARAVLAADPSAEVTVVTGVPVRPAWLRGRRMSVVTVPDLLKDPDGSYRSSAGDLGAALAQRSVIVADLVEDLRPDVVVVDRHPFGTAGELREGLDRAKRRGAVLVLGLRDILDDAERVATELAGVGWEGVRDVYDELLVYGSPQLCDHAAEYHVPLPPRYCGWVAPSLSGAVSPQRRRHLVVAAGGGGDGKAVYELGLRLAAQRTDWTASIVAGPYAAGWSGPDPSLAGRVEVLRDGGACLEHFASAGAVLQMAGYNSTVECLGAGMRPILVPRREPRREQAIRASRLAALGLADVVDEGASISEVDWLLDRPRRVGSMATRRAGLRFDGAREAARVLARLVGERAGRGGRTGPSASASHASASHAAGSWLAAGA